jgi:glycosyltransferase involved in cell wall biosynthesis
VYDGLHVAAHLLDQGGQVPEGTPFLLRAHNREAELWRQKARLARTLPERLFFAAQARAMARFEGSIARRARGVATVSDRDRALLLQDVPQLLPERVVTIPIGYEFGTPPRFPDADPWQLLFVGRLDWPPNREGLRWFLDSVWPAVLKEAPRWRLTVAGSGDGGWLASYRATPRVDIRGFVHDVTELYETSSLAILPLFVGSGTRVKAIEAARFGRPCLSTALGVEGLGLVNDVNYLGAETAREWTRRLVDAQPEDLRMKGQQAWQALQRAFDLTAPAADFLALARRAATAQGE